MKRALLLFAATVSCAAAPARAPVSAVDLPGAFAAAFGADATGDPADAARAYLAVVREASRAAGDPWQIPALEASLDALATRQMPALGDAARDAAIFPPHAARAGDRSLPRGGRGRGRRTLRQRSHRRRAHGNGRGTR